MRVLITGITGFIGSQIARQLVKSGCQVIGLSSGTNDRLQRIGVNRIIQADIRDSDSVEKLILALGECDAVVHCAARISMNNDDKSLIPVNCQGTMNMVQSANLLRAKTFVYLSSIPVIGKPKQIPVTEHHPTHPSTIYHATKLFAESVVSLRGNAFRPVILRISAPVGPGTPRHRLISVLVSKALKGTHLELDGSGNRRQNYIDVRDIANAVKQSLSSRCFGVFNIASRSATSNVELAELCIDMTRSSSTVGFSGKPDPQDDYNWEISTEKAMSELGFLQKYEIKDSIDCTINELSIHIRDKK